jgi:hypothetical protein
MEKLLMDFCQIKAGIKDPQDDKNLDGAWDGAHNNVVARAKAIEPVEVDWDSDEDYKFFCCHPHLNEIDQISYFQYPLN